MKAKLLRDELITHPNIKSFDHLKALAGRLHRGEISKAQFNARTHLAAKAGTIIDHPQAFQLVALGRAEPVDDECRKRAAMALPGGEVDFDAALANAVEAADRTDDCQVTGDPEFDATPEQVEAMRAARAARISNAG